MTTMTPITQLTDQEVMMGEAAYRLTLTRRLELKALEAIQAGDSEAFKSVAHQIDAIRKESSGGIDAPWDLMTPKDKGNERLHCIFRVVQCAKCLPGHPEMMRFMMTRGLDLNNDTANSAPTASTMMTFVVRTADPEFLKVFLELGASPDGPYENHVLAGMFNPIRLLLNDSLTTGDQVSEKLKILLDAGASFEITRVATLFTPLALAANSGRWNAVLPLLQMGQDPYEKSEFDDKDAFQKAAEANSNGVLCERMRAWESSKKASEAIEGMLSTSDVSSSDPGDHQVQGSLNSPKRASSASAGQRVARS